MRRKTAQYRIADVKAVPPEGSGEGIVEAVVAVFGNVDLVGDRIVKGAFRKSLDRWKASGDPVPLIFDHQWGNLDAHAGEVLEAEELEPGDERLPDSIKNLGGLWIKAILDLEDDFARKLFNKLKRGRVREWSFAYDVLDEREAKDANELIELDLIEVGPTLKGANPETRTVAVKSEQTEDDETDDDDDEETPPVDAPDGAATLAVKAGRVLSSKNEAKIREALGLLSEVLDSVQKQDEDGGKSLGPSERTTTPTPTDLRLLMQTEILQYEAAS